MAAEMIPAGSLPVLSDAPTHPGPNATPLEHAVWCERFAGYCETQAQIALQLKLPGYSRWLKAFRISQFAGEVWRERLEREGAV